MAAAAEALPRWDMTVVYPGLDSPEFTASFAAATKQVSDLAALFDRHRIERTENQAIDATLLAAFDEVTTRLNEAMAAQETLDAYISAFVETDTRDDIAQARTSELDSARVAMTQLGSRYVAWVGGLDLDALLQASEVARAHEFPLRQIQVDAGHQMSPAEEDLVAALGPSAGSAWGRLHGNLSSQIDVAVELDGERQTLPMSAVRNLAHHVDREVRRRAFEAEIAAWEQAALPLAASLNGIKGEVLTLSRRRRWESPLAEMLHLNRIDEATLAAMLDAAERAFPDFRRYLKAKARALGVPALAWYDLFAPVGGGDDKARWSYANSEAFILEHFGSYSERMREFAARAFRERWIDAEPRPGKVDGAFCMWLQNDESRILANFEPSYGAMSTLAHELGHAYHNLNEAGLTPLQRDTPLTMAETASIFCETVVKEAALANASAPEQLAILEASLQDNCQVVVDISSRFRFERGVFAGREERDLSIEELNGLMLRAQRETYGDGVDGATLHPYMWAVKGHYYSTGISYYNFPYMFGLLFGLGVYARSKEEPEAFRARYDDLLASTGRADAATLAARFGIDLREPGFWEASLALVRADIDRFEGLVDGEARVAQ